MNQILKHQTSRSHYGSKVPAVTITVFKYRNKIGKIVVKAVPYSVTWMSKICLRHTLIKKYPWYFSWLLYLYTFSPYENASLIIVSAETEYISTRSWYRNINFLRDLPQTKRPMMVSKTLYRKTTDWATWISQNTRMLRKG